MHQYPICKPLCLGTHSSTLRWSRAGTHSLMGVPLALVWVPRCPEPPARPQVASVVLALGQLLGLCRVGLCASHRGRAGTLDRTLPVAAAKLYPCSDTCWRMYGTHSDKHPMSVHTPGIVDLFD